MSCTYTPWVYVCIYICMVKYSYIFTPDLHISISITLVLNTTCVPSCVYMCLIWCVHIYPHSSYLLSLQALFAITHYSYQWLVHLNKISPIIWCIRITLPILPKIIDSLSTTLPISYICVYIHTYEYKYMYSINSSVYYDVRESIRVHMYMTILSLIYTFLYVYICMCLYIYIHLYIHTYIYFYLMDASSMPKIAMSSGDLPAVSCTKS